MRHSPKLAAVNHSEERRAIGSMGDFRALDPFFPAIEQGLAGFVDGDHFFDLHAQEKVFDLIITILNHQHHVVGRAKPIELYRSYGSTSFLDRRDDLRTRCAAKLTSRRIFARLRRRQPLSDTRHRGERNGPVPSCPVAGDSSVRSSCEGYCCER